jgi:hypothetical protein
MNVQQLIEILQDLDPTAEVIISRDPEGNGYSPASEHLGEGHFHTKDAEFYSDEDLDYLEADAEDEKQKISNDCIPCVCIWPVY